LRAQRPDGPRAGSNRFWGAAVQGPSGLDDATWRAGAIPNAHHAGGNPPRGAATVTGRRRFRRSAGDLATSAGAGQRPADNARALSSPGSPLWPGAVRTDPRRVAVVVRI